MEYGYANSDTARVSVHFRSVTEKLTPHDTIFAFNKAAELHDSALSAACSLHAANSSFKPSNHSNPPPSLAGITEDVWESRADNAEQHGNDKRQKRISLARQTSRDSQTRSERLNGGASAKPVHEKSTSITTTRSLQRARTISSVDKALPPIPKEANRERVVDMHERISLERIAPRSILDHSDDETRPAVEGRISSQSARPSTRDLYDAYGHKQKVKLGPRPSTESTGRSDNVDRTNHFRPVATLPAGLRMPTRKPAPRTAELERPQSQQTQRTFPSSLPQTEKPPSAPVTPIQIPDRKIPLVYKGLLTPAKTPVEANSAKITPEKRRLMKALQLRQKQLAAQKATTSVGIEDTPPELEYTKPELDDSILSAISYASNPEADPDIVHVAVRDLSKEDPRNVEASPISIPEISDGPSTQASSITDEEDLAAQKGEESNLGEDAALPQDHIVPSQISDANNCPETSYDRQTGSHQSSQVDNLRGYACANSDQSVLTGPDELVRPSAVEEGTAAEHVDLQRKVKPAIVVGDPQVLTSGKEVSTGNLAEDCEKAVPTSSSATSFVVGDSEDRTKGGAASMLEPHGTDNSATPPERRQSAQPDVTPILNIEMLALDVDFKDQSLSQNTSPKISEPPFERDALSSQASPPVKDGGITETVCDEGSSSLYPVDHIKPFQVPLPPIGGHEESRLMSDGIALQASLVPSSATQIESPSQVSQTKRTSQDSELTTTRPSTSETISEQQAERQTRRRSVVNPQQRLSSPEHSDEQFLSDDSFMEELKSATLQEAKPISVSKSPIKPVFSRSDSDQRFADPTKANRSVSSPLDQPGKDEEILSPSRLPTPLSSRSLSANQALRPESQQTSAPIPKKLGVSSGISQRIKALEQLSSRPSSPQSISPSNASASITQRKTSFRSHPVTSDAKSNLTNKSRPSSTYPSPSPSPEAVKSNPFNHLNQAGYSQPESISVTATIVRDPRNKKPEMPLNPAEPRTLDLHQSPLVVEHQKMIPPPLSPLKPPRPPYTRYSSARAGSSSSTEQKVETPQTTRRDSFASMLSRSSRAGSEADLPRSLSDSIIGITNREESREDKKDSRRSRLMKRMSGISSMSRRSIVNALSPSPKEAPRFERQESIAEMPPSVVDVGDVNVQFPDTLVSPPCGDVRLEINLGSSFGRDVTWSSMDKAL